MQKQKYKTGLMWFRRDLRTQDNAALHHALKSCARVFCIFIFDRDILDGLPRSDRRVEFIRESLVDLDGQLRQLALASGTVASLQDTGGLLVRHETARAALPALVDKLAADAVFANHDDEPYSLARDGQIADKLKQCGVDFHTFKDHVVFERQELATLAGRPYTVFTPYKNAWLKKIDASCLTNYSMGDYGKSLAFEIDSEASGVPSLEAIGFEKTNLSSLPIPPGSQGAEALFAEFMERIGRYQNTRDFPAVKGPSYLSVHLRFGTISIRRLAAAALAEHQSGNAGASTWLSELIWRDFYAQILANFPHVTTGAFKPEYDAIKWEEGQKAVALFQAWCQGKTGYPLVDAAMAQINQTGYMHNRLRMVTASFLIKDLGVDWRWGERYFAEKLNDYDLASNNGGWQWAASTGCDAQPYFRIFNPTSQSEKFDKDGKFIRRYLPMLAALPIAQLHTPWITDAAVHKADVLPKADYPEPVVVHADARATTLQRYAVVKKDLAP